MCSVRHRPMPSAPFARARCASSGVSAFAHTCIRRTPSAQPSSVFNSASSSGLGSIVSISPTNTSPVAPSRLMMSPSAMDFPRAVARPSASKRNSSQPTMHGLPSPRVTTAAWLVIPPRLVSTPCDLMMPCTSSGLVCWRTRITRCPPSSTAAARSGSITTTPETAPGEAPTPSASRRPSFTAAAFASVTKCGISTAETSPASTRPSACSCVSTPSPASSTAIRTAAAAVRLAERVCRMYSFPRSTVNSMSCTSL